jgi:hypothetical protein
MDSPRTAAKDPALAVVAMQEMEGRFDPDILRKFTEMVGFYPVGSFVKLRNSLLAMVVEQSESVPTKPTVRTFYSLKEHERIKGRTLDLTQRDDAFDILDSVDLTGLDLPSEAELRDALFFESLQR